VAVVSWNQLPDLTYWIFFQAGSSVVPAVPGVPIIRSAQSPRVVTGLSNGTQYAFVMNATNQDSPAGPASVVVLATPRLAGATATWASGTPLGGVPLQNLNAVAFSGTRLVAVGDAGTLFAGDYNYTSDYIISTNPPGVTAWAPPTSVPTPFAKDLKAVIFTGTLFAALAADGSIVTSADGGLTWTSVIPTNQITANGMNAIALGFVPGAMFVAVGAAGSIFTSSDLANWTSVVPITSNDLYAVSFLNGGFVATGANGTLLTSPDGSNWTPQDSKTTNALRGAVYAAPLTGARYVAVGDAGTIVTSSDVLAWGPVAPPLSQNLRSVVFGSRFVAVGQGGAAAYSDDGVTWSPASTGLADLNAVIFTPAMYVAVGASGANAVSR
jgi:photosystem II stability/assembly factor-like uncharacterized protein